jgi:hypothetical protein
VAAVVAVAMVVVVVVAVAAVVVVVVDLVVTTGLNAGSNSCLLISLINVNQTATGIDTK